METTQINSTTEIAQNLNTLLADQHIIYLKTRNFHWNVTGPYFHSLHAMFEEQYTELALHIDETAERIRMIGAHANGSFEAYLSNTRLAEAINTETDALSMVSQLLKDHEAVANFVRHDLKTAEDHNDQSTADLLAGLLAWHEKTAWMLRAHIS